MSELAAERHLQRATIIALALLLLLLLLLEALPGIDFWISQQFYDPWLHRFPQAHAFFWRDIMHDGVRRLMRIAQVAAVLVLLLGVCRRQWRRWRRSAIYFLLASLLATSIVAALKTLSARACPHMLSAFGGGVSFHPLWSGVRELQGGRCWPGGHVLHAYSLLPLFWIFWRAGQKRRAYVSLIAVMLFGAALGLTQIVRGEHFLSHNLWSLWCCALVSALLDHFYLAPGSVSQAREVIVSS